MALLDIEAGFWSIRRQLEALIGNRLTNNVLQQAGANGGASFAESLGTSKDITQQGRLFASCVQAYQTAGFGKYDIAEAQWPIGRVIIRAQDAFEAWMMRQHEQRVDDPVCAYTAGVLVGFINVISDRRDVVCIERHCQALGDEACEFELLPAAEVDEQSVVAFTPDPKLGRQINLLEILFERMPMGIAVLDREYRIQRYNPTWVDYSKTYSPPSAALLAPGVGYFEHLPGTESMVLPLFDRTLDGETVRQNSVRLESEGIVTYWDIVLAPLVENDKVVGILSVSVDATEREEAKQNLEQRVVDRTRDLQMLLDVAAATNHSLNLDEMLETTLDLLVTLIGASRVGVMIKDEASGELEARMIRPAQTISPEDLEQIMPACEAVADSDEPLFVVPGTEQRFVEPGALLPLRVQDRTLGVLVIVGMEGEQFSPEQQRLLRSIADQLGVAVENARLYKQVEQAAVTMERSRLARDLHDAVTQTLFSASLVAEVLPKLWEKDPDEGRRRLEEIRQLTRGALSEMRTLLLELRPAALVDTDLGDLISHLINAFIARTRLTVEYKKEVDGNPPPAVKEVFYRVAQEAFANIAKHAEATKVSANLACQSEYVELIIKDNGCGFNPVEVSADHLGLGIMEERAHGIQANLIIDSQRDQGSTIQLTWELAKMEPKNE